MLVQPKAKTLGGSAHLARPALTTAVPGGGEGAPLQITFSTPTPLLQKDHPFSEREWREWGRPDRERIFSSESSFLLTGAEGCLLPSTRKLELLRLPGLPPKGKSMFPGLIAGS